MQTNKISMSDAANGFKLSFKLPQVLRMLIVQSLNCNWSGILQNALVHRAGSTITNYIPFTKIICDSHYIIECVYGHVHMKNN